MRLRLTMSEMSGFLWMWRAAFRHRPQWRPPTLQSCKPHLQMTADAPPDTQPDSFSLQSVPQHAVLERTIETYRSNPPKYICRPPKFLLLPGGIMQRVIY